MADKKAVSAAAKGDQAEKKADKKDDKKSGKKPGFFAKTSLCAWASISKIPKAS